MPVLAHICGFSCQPIFSHIGEMEAGQQPAHNWAGDAKGKKAGFLPSSMTQSSRLRKMPPAPQIHEKFLLECDLVISQFS